MDTDVPDGPFIVDTDGPDGPFIVDTDFPDGPFIVDKNISKTHVDSVRGIVCSPDAILTLSQCVLDVAYFSSGDF